MGLFIGLLTICVLFLIASIILGHKNRSMLLSVGCAIFSVIGTLFTLFTSIPTPTIYPLNTEATIYNGTAKVDIKSYPIFTIYYSLDGSDPKDGNIYTDSFTITETTTVAARNRFMHLFWSDPPSKSTFRFESVQNITSKNVDDSINNQMTIEDFFVYLIFFLLICSLFIPMIRGR